MFVAFVIDRILLSILVHIFCMQNNVDVSHLPGVPLTIFFFICIAITSIGLDVHIALALGNSLKIGTFDAGHIAAPHAILLAKIIIHNNTIVEFLCSGNISFWVCGRSEERVGSIRILLLSF